MFSLRGQFCNHTDPIQNFVCWNVEHPESATMLPPSIKQSRSKSPSEGVDNASQALGQQN